MSKVVRALLVVCFLIMQLPMVASAQDVGTASVIRGEFGVWIAQSYIEGDEANIWTRTLNDTDSGLTITTFIEVDGVVYNKSAYVPSHGKHEFHRFEVPAGAAQEGSWFDFWSCAENACSEKESRQLTGVGPQQGTNFFTEGCLLDGFISNDPDVAFYVGEQLAFQVHLEEEELISHELGQPLDFSSYSQVGIPLEVKVISVWPGFQTVIETVILGDCSVTPTSTPVPTVPATSTPVPTEPATSTPVPTEPATNTPVPTVPATSTPVPTVPPDVYKVFCPFVANQPQPQPVCERFERMTFGHEGAGFTSSFTITVGYFVETFQAIGFEFDGHDDPREDDIPGWIEFFNQSHLVRIEVIPSGDPVDDPNKPIYEFRVDNMITHVVIHPPYLGPRYDSFSYKILGYLEVCK